MVSEYYPKKRVSCEDIKGNLYPATRMFEKRAIQVTSSAVKPKDLQFSFKATSGWRGQQTDEVATTTRVEYLSAMSKS